jgi:hypothetical protein
LSTRTRSSEHQGGCELTGRELERCRPDRRHCPARQSAVSHPRASMRWLKAPGKA